MAHLTTGERTFLKDAQLYGTKVRTLLGLQDSAVVVADDGTARGYFGEEAKVELVKAETKEDGLGNALELPLDFRSVGIAVLSASGVPEDTQIKMFKKFMTFPKDQRDAYVAQYEALDLNNYQDVQAFVQNMTSLLS